MISDESTLLLSLLILSVTIERKRIDPFFLIYSVSISFGESSSNVFFLLYNSLFFISNDIAPSHTSNCDYHVIIFCFAVDRKKSSVVKNVSHLLTFYI
jgi:hypothetical protein